MNCTKNVEVIKHKRREEKTSREEGKEEISIREIRSAFGLARLLVVLINQEPGFETDGCDSLD